MFNGSMPSEQASVFKPIGTSGHSDQESKGSKEPVYLGAFRRQRIEMEDNSGWIPKIEKIINSSTRRLVIAITVASTAIVGVPLWLYEQNGEALLAVQAGLASDIGKLKIDLGDDISELKVDLTRSIGELKADIATDVGEIKSDVKTVETKVIDNGHAIGRIETNLNRLLKIQEK